MVSIDRGPPMTLGNPARAGVKLVVRCLDCHRQVDFVVPGDGETIASSDSTRSAPPRARIHNPAKPCPTLVVMSGAGRGRGAVDLHMISRGGRGRRRSCVNR
jgi:hypothetical protein